MLWLEKRGFQLACLPDKWRENGLIVRNTDTHTQSFRKKSTHSKTNTQTHSLNYTFSDTNDLKCAHGDRVLNRPIIR